MLPRSVSLVLLDPASRLAKNVGVENRKVPLVVAPQFLSMSEFGRSCSTSTDTCSRTIQSFYGNGLLREDNGNGDTIHLLLVPASRRASWVVQVCSLNLSWSSVLQMTH